MAKSIRVTKVMRFAIDIAEKQARERKFYSPAFKDSDYINFILSEWLRQNYTQKELFDMGFDDIFDDDL